jgi:hypothetical protein
LTAFNGDNLFFNTPTIQVKSSFAKFLLFHAPLAHPLSPVLARDLKKEAKLWSKLFKVRV